MVANDLHPIKADWLIKVHFGKFILANEEQLRKASLWISVHSGKLIVIKL